MPNNNSHSRDAWSHLQLGETQHDGAPLDPGEKQRLKQYLEQMFPDLHERLSPFIGEITEFLHNGQLSEEMTSSLANDIIEKISVSSLPQGMPRAIPTQAPVRERNRPRPMPFPPPYPYYPPFGYPVYRYDLSVEDLLRIMLLQRLGLYPY